MDAAEAVITGKLKTLRRELGEKIRAEQAYQEERAERRHQREVVRQAEWEEFERQLREGQYPTRSMPMAETGPLTSLSSGYFKRLLDIDRLEAQVKLLQELQKTLDEQHGEKREPIVAVNDQDDRSFKQNFWPTFTTSAISLLLGWLLSLLGTPATVLHLFRP